MIAAYRSPFDKVVDRIISERDINIFQPLSNTNGVPAIALWDTGANVTCLSETVARQMSLVKINERELTVADNKTYTANVYCIKLQMCFITFDIMEVCGLPMDGKRQNMIIGMDIINKGDLSITNYQGQSYLSFRYPSLERIDYVEEINVYNKCLKKHNVNVLHHIKTDNCACNSGKIYKNCHGQSVYAKYENSLKAPVDNYPKH